MIPLTERLLYDAGGWQAMKAARGLHAAGRVSEATYEVPILRGLVKEGPTQYRAGLRIGAKTDIENLCTCRDSRGRGLICAHSLAVGLAVLHPPKPAPVPTVPSVNAEVAPETEVRGTDGTVFSTEKGETLRVHILVPPNFADAWERGSISLAIEAQTRGSRRILSALPPGKPWRCDGSDLAFLRAAFSLTSGEIPGMLGLNTAQAEKLMEALIDHPRVTLGRDRPLGMKRAGDLVPLQIDRLTDGGASLRVVFPEDQQALAGASSVWIWNTEHTQLLRVAEGLPGAYLEVFRKSVTVPAAASAGFLQKELPALRQWFALSGSALAFGPEAGTSSAPAVAPETVQFTLKIEGSLNYLVAELESRIGQRRTTITSSGYRPVHPAESAALARLRKCGFDGPTPKSEWMIRGEKAILQFFANDLPVFKREWNVSIGSRFEHVTSNFERVQARFEVKGSGQNWFEVGFALAADGGESLSADEVRRLLASGRRTVKLRNQKTAVLTDDVLNEFGEFLKDTSPVQPMPGSYRFDQRDAAYFKAFTDRVGAFLGGKAAQANWNASLPFAKPPPAKLELGNLATQLRSYQVEGIEWLNKLYNNGLQGLLADEMGLGKTVQTLGFLRQLRGPKLVVCPASLTLNWQREAERFTPELRAVRSETLTGDELIKLCGEDRLLISSYGLLRRDIDCLQQAEFAAIALDEAQHIKNPDSQTARAAHRLRAQTRLALTGTPIENGVRDIWSIMHFLMPGYLGDRERFRERFEVPIQTRPGGPEHRRLVQRLSPFILRRTKREVAKDLPDKIQQVSYCELTSDQKDLYGKLLKAARQRITQASDSKTGGQAKLAAFTALLRLRQVCCDLQLLGDELADSAASSAKRELLSELLDEAITDGHRVLVFSQFASMLRLIAKDLEQVGVRYCYLDGATRNRQAEVDRFQSGDAPVFLISLKAGGVGLNLTAADTVILFDPWWNPAVEAQATDRAHRIGQQRTVNVYRLIARGTVEEKILRLQEKKRAMADELVVDSEEPMMSGLTMEDFAELVS